MLNNVFKLALDPARIGLHASRTEYALRAHNLLPPPPLTLFENAGSAPE